MLCVILFIANGAPSGLFRFCLDNSTVPQVLPVRYSFLSFVTHHCNTYKAALNYLPNSLEKISKTV